MLENRVSVLSLDNNVLIQEMSDVTGIKGYKGAWLGAPGWGL